MNDDEAKALESLAESATPGPWVQFTDGGRPQTIMPAGRPGDICVTRKSTREDAAFITMARTAIPSLLSDRRQLQSHLADAKAILDSLRNGDGDARGARIVRADGSSQWLSDAVEEWLERVGGK